MRALSFSAVFMLSAVVLSGCSGEVAKDATAAVVGKGIEVSKGTVTGIAAGIEQGRKQGESADGAVIVSTKEELAALGGAKVGAIDGTDAGSTISILIENAGDKPARATKLDVIILDKDGVVQTGTESAHELTIPPHAKAKLQVKTPLAADLVGTVRLYGQDLAR